MLHRHCWMPLWPSFASLLTNQILSDSMQIVYYSWGCFPLFLSHPSLLSPVSWNTCLNVIKYNLTDASLTTHLLTHEKLQGSGHNPGEEYKPSNLPFTLQRTEWTAEQSSLLPWQMFSRMLWLKKMFAPCYLTHIEDGSVLLHEVKTQFIGFFRRMSLKHHFFKSKICRGQKRTTGTAKSHIQAKFLFSKYASLLLSTSMS